MSDDEVNLGGEVIRPNFRRESGVPVVIDRERDSVCEHSHVHIRQYQHKVICRRQSCGAEVDPFDVLMKLARKWEHATYLQFEIDKQEAKLELLKAEEKRCKARIKNAGGTVMPAWQLEQAAIEAMRELKR